MDPSTLPPALRDSIQWAGNGVLTYYDPDFPYADLSPQRVNSARETYSTSDDEYIVEGTYQYADTPLPPSCRVQYPYGPKEVFAALVREVANSSSSDNSPSSPGTVDSPGSSQDESSEPSSESEDDEMPLPVRPLIRRRVTTESYRAPEPERPRQRIADHERRHPRHHSPSPPREPPREWRETRQGRAFQGPAAQRVQEGVSHQQPQLPRPSTHGEQGHRGQRPSVNVGQSAPQDSLRERFENLRVRSEPSSPEGPADPPSRLVPSQRRSSRPENPRRTDTYAGSYSSSGRPRRIGDFARPPASEAPRPLAQPALSTPRRQSARPDPRRRVTHAGTSSSSGRTHGSQENRPVVQSHEASHAPAQPRRSASQHQPTRPAAPRRATTHESSATIASSSSQSTQDQSSLAAHLSILDAQYRPGSKLMKEDDVGSMVVQVHVDSASVCRRRRRQKERESRPAPPPEPKSSRLGFLKHFTKKK
ncbi:uncharacterized protein F4807DRAFT_468351 [Annulohypoxylon truncatum]|uniref:uncharacterized protein n=1 Tax=Annulohypoxylon truncatum TaxID=327061 RepID=UPI002008D584|nr:uncharacterized protein F4807DRAFT_468351 [Annulohypoxylon truncatum]KAI1214472.1 hypothetical protein F4807DRAFT_468351 [Annulohypoxylon truncatum]